MVVYKLQTNVCYNNY